jgi:polyferredoxin
MAKSRTPLAVWLRRLVQLSCFGLFTWLLIETAYHPINRVGGHVTLFFDLDPLVVLSVWIATHVLAASFWLAGATLLGTLLFGRFFCGWVCPFGAVHTLFSNLRSGKAKAKLAAGGYSPWQRAKYLALVFCLAGALVGVNVTGWLDPFSFLYRSMATAVHPVANLMTQGVFTWLYQANPGVGPVRATAVSEPIYQVLRRTVLPVNQPYFQGGLLIGILFALVAGLNAYRARLWCRYVCPLGGLLGVAGKNPLVRVTREAGLCNDCRACRIDCHGGANPDGDWRPTECLYCWNCVQACPTKGIRIGFALPAPRVREPRP